MTTIFSSCWLISRWLNGRQRTATMTDDGASDDEPFSMVATMAAVFAAALSFSIGRYEIQMWEFQA